VIDAVLSPLASNKIYRICRGKFEPQILVLYKLIPIHHLPRFVAPRVAVWFRKAIQYRLSDENCHGTIPWCSRGKKITGQLRN